MRRSEKDADGQPSAGKASAGDAEGDREPSPEVEAVAGAAKSLGAVALLALAAERLTRRR